MQNQNLMSSNCHFEKQTNFDSFLTYLENSKNCHYLLFIMSTCISLIKTLNEEWDISHSSMVG